MTVYYTVVAECERYDGVNDQTIYKTTQLANLASIVDEISERYYDHVDLTISDGETTTTVEVAT